MLRRWIIRSLVLLPLACAVGVWIASYFGLFVMNMNLKPYEHALGAVQGLGTYGYVPLARPPSSMFYFNFYRHLTARDGYLDSTTLGFRWGTVPRIHDSLQIIFPLWLPTLLLAALNGFVWHKTRKRTTRGAFPVEPPVK